MSVAHSRSRLVQLALLTAAAFFAAPASGSAQAWLPAQGEGYVSTLFTNMSADKHYLPTTRYDLGEIDSNALLFDVTYGVTDRMAVSVSLPLVVSRYRGSFPHPGTQPTKMDDGTWHSTFQDFRFNVRYNVLRGPITITPFLGTALPSHPYEYWAHSAAGRRLRELHAGVTAARQLDEVTPRLFLQGRYAFTLPERALDVRPYRSNADLEIGYFVSPSVRVLALGAAQLTHSGIDLPRNAASILTPLQRQHHDQIGRENFLNVGLGAAVDISDSVAVFGSVVKQVAGRNTHEMTAMAIGITWSFRLKGEEPLISRRSEQSLSRCACQKALN